MIKSIILVYLYFDIMYRYSNYFYRIELLKIVFSYEQISVDYIIYNNVHIIFIITIGPNYL